MAVDKEDEEWFEDDCCMNCGEFHYRESGVPGLCSHCVAELAARE